MPSGKGVGASRVFSGVRAEIGGLNMRAHRPGASLRKSFGKRIDNGVSLC